MVTAWHSARASWNKCGGLTNSGPGCFQPLQSWRLLFGVDGDARAQLTRDSHNLYPGRVWKQSSGRGKFNSARRLQLLLPWKFQLLWMNFTYFFSHWQRNQYNQHLQTSQKHSTHKRCEQDYVKSDILVKTTQARRSINSCWLRSSQYQ